MDGSYGLKHGHVPESVAVNNSEVTENFEASPHSSPPSIARRLGWVSLFVIVLGTFVVFGCMALVIFLWNGSDSSNVWHQIVIGGWIPRSITIISLVLRLVVSSQAALSTSMIAALMFEFCVVRLPDLAAVSLIRFSNNGPRSILRYLPRRASIRGMGLGVLALMMTITTVLLQFSSTALLSDVGLGSLVLTEQLNMPYSITPGLTTTQIEVSRYSSMRPASYPPFAEYSEPASSVEGTSDTGVSVRAFLPVADSASRNNMTSYVGKATILDSRVVCMQPQVENMRVRAIYGSPQITGSVWTEYTVPGFGPYGLMRPGVPFNCSWALQGFFNLQYSYSLEWPLALCAVGDVTSPNAFNVTTSVPSQLARGGAFLLINSTGTTSEWGPINNAGGAFNVDSSLASGSWISYRSSQTNASISMSLCFVGASADETNVQAARSSPHGAEAVVSWENDTATFDTYDVRKQIGATAQRFTLAERNIFSLARPNITDTNQPVYTGNNVASVATINAGAFNYISTSNSSVLLCKYCQPNGLAIARVHSQVFGDIIGETGDPALAIQSLLTTLFGMSYYDHTFQFDITAPANVSTQVSVLKPTGTAFFHTFLVVVVMHLCLVMATSVLFILSNPATILGNAWSTVSQLWDTESDGWLRVAKDLSDKEVSQAMESNGVANRYLGLVRRGGNLRLVQNL